MLALKSECPDFTVLNIHFSSFRILNNLRLPWKTESAMEFFTVLKYFLSFRIFEQVVLVLETRFCPEFTVLNIYFSSFRILNNLRLPRKTGSALEFLTVLNYFLSFRFMRNLSLPWNQSFPWIFQAGGRPLPPPAASYATAKTYPQNYPQYYTLGTPYFTCDFHISIGFPILEMSQEYPFGT